MFLTLLGEYAADLPLSEYLDSMKVNFNKNEKFQKLNSIDYNKAVAISNLEDLGGSKKSIFSFKKNNHLKTPEESIFYGHRLLDGHQDIFDFVSRGVCHDATAYTRHLLGSKFSDHKLKTNLSKDWIDEFNFKNGQEWDGERSLPGGKAVGFYNELGGTIFHSGIAVGGTEIRAINGLDLGASWMHPVDLKSVLRVRNQDGTFDYDCRKIRVFISDV